MADSNPDERIVIEHPEIPKSRNVQRRSQLVGTWAAKGFVEVEGADPDNLYPALDTLPVPEQESAEDPEAAPAAKGTSAKDEPKASPKSGGAK